MVRNGEVWSLPDTALPPVGARYRLFPFPNNSDYYDLSNPNYQPFSGLLGFTSVYTDGPLRLDPRAYARPREASQVTWLSASPQAQFGELSKHLRGLTRRIMFARSRTIGGAENWRAMYDPIDAEIDSLAAVYGPTFSQLLLQKRLQVLAKADPETAIRKADVSASTDSLKQALHRGEAFQSYIDEVIGILGDIDLDSPFYRTPPVWVLLAIGDAIRETPALQRAYGLMSDRLQFSPGYNPMEDYLLSVVDYARTDDMAQSILWIMAGYYNQHRQHDRVNSAIAELLWRFPRSTLVEDGFLARMAQSQHVGVGATAPSLEGSDVLGQAVALSDLHAKYVYLYFWARGCGFSRRELSDVCDLHRSFAPEELAIIGLANLAHDSVDYITSYTRDNGVPFPIMVADEEILKDYGVVAYPTSFLIAPGGRIIARDLRGPDLPMLVRDQIVQDRVKENASKGLE